MSDDLTAWLRKVVGERLALARMAVSVQADVEDGAQPSWNGPSVIAQAGIMIGGCFWDSTLPTGRRSARSRLQR
jgi:hypothetical protein